MPLMVRLPTQDAAVTLVAARRRAREENFPVALRLLPPAPQRQLQAVYAVARLIDDVGDDVDRSPAERIAAIEELRADIARLWTGDVPAHPVVRALAPTVAAAELPRAPFDALLDANLLDQTTYRYETREDLAAYCALSANPVGHLVLTIARQSTPRNIALSDDVCTALQLIEHCQDVVEDLRDRDRLYLPLTDLRRHGVAVSDLLTGAASPAMRALIASEVEWAEQLLASGGRLVAQLRGWGRVAVAGYVGGGLATVDAFKRAGYDVVTAVPQPRRHRLAAHSARLLVARR
jgi:squalene synthase HpnC